MGQECTIWMNCLCCPTPKAQDIRRQGQQCELCWHWYPGSEMYKPTKGVYVCQVCWF